MRRNTRDILEVLVKNYNIYYYNIEKNVDVNGEKSERLE